MHQKANFANISGLLAYVNGEYTSIDQAVVHVQHWGLRRADAVYDVFSFSHGMLFYLDAHLDRFAESMRKNRMSIKESREEIRSIAHELAKRSGLEQGCIGIDCIRSLPAAGEHAHPAYAPCYFMACVRPYSTAVSKEAVERGAHFIISSVPRISPESVDPTCKNFNRGDFTRANFEALDRGADKPILLDQDGNVTEGPGFNVFAVVDGVVVTPRDGVLEGITRKAVLEILDMLKIEHEVRAVSADEFRNAEEIFLSSTTGGVIGVSRLDERILTNDRPGPMTRRLQNEYWRLRETGFHGERIGSFVVD